MFLKRRKDPRRATTSSPNLLSRLCALIFPPNQWEIRAESDLLEREVDWWLLKFELSAETHRRFVDTIRKSDLDARIVDAITNRTPVPDVPSRDEIRLWLRCRKVQFDASGNLRAEKIQELRPILEEFKGAKTESKQAEQQ